MDTIELKFVLKLLGEANYRTLLSKIQLNNQTKASDRERICRKLCDRGWTIPLRITKLIWEKLQPPLSREQLDQALYHLQRNDQIELSSLQHVTTYTPEQIGGPLFFIVVN